MSVITDALRAIDIADKKKPPQGLVLVDNIRGRQLYPQQSPMVLAPMPTLDVFSGDPVVPQVPAPPPTQPMVLVPLNAPPPSFDIISAPKPVVAVPTKGPNRRVVPWTPADGGPGPLGKVVPLAVPQTPRATPPSPAMPNDNSLYSDPAFIQEQQDAASENAMNPSAPPVTLHRPEYGTSIEFPPDTTAAEIAQVYAQMDARAAQQQKLQALQGVGGLINEAMNYQPQYATIDKAAAAGMTPQAMQSFTDMQNRKIAEQQAIDMEIRRIQAQQSMDQRRMDNLNVNKRLDRALTVNDARQRAELAREQARINAQRQLDELEYRKKYLEEQSRHNSAMEGAAQDRADAYASKASDQNFNEDYDIGNGLMYFAQGDMERVTKDGIPVYIGKRGSYFERQAKMEEQKYKDAMDYEKSLISANYDPKEARQLAEERFGTHIGGSAQSEIPSGLVKMVDKETGEIVFVDQASQQVYTAEELKGMNK